MFTVAIGTMMAVLDGTIANVALPTLTRELQIDEATSVWIVNAFQVALTATLLPFSALGDAFGYRSVYRAGIVVFTVGSLACALSHSFPALIAARVLQGFGASAIMSVGPALYRMVFPRALLGRGLGLSALVVASSATAGPTIGGAILAIAPWPWLFAINIPVGLAVIALSARTLPRQTVRGGPVDVPSALTGGPSIGFAVVAVDGFAHHAPPALVGLGVLGAIGLLVFFFRRQRQIEHPLLALDIFRAPGFSLAVATSFCSFTAQGLAFVAFPFLYQTILNYSAFQSGLLVMPWPLAVALIAPFAGRASDRIRPAVLATAGLCVFTAGLAALALLPNHPATLDLIWRSALCGIGFGIFQSPNNREILGNVPAERSGNASGMLATVRVTGQTLGAALVAAIIGLAGAGELGRAAAIALALAAIAAGCAALVSATRLRSGPAS